MNIANVMFVSRAEAKVFALCQCPWSHRFVSRMTLVTHLSASALGLCFLKFLVDSFKARLPHRKKSIRQRTKLFLRVQDEWVHPVPAVKTPGGRQKPAPDLVSSWQGQDQMVVLV